MLSRLARPVFLATIVTSSCGGGDSFDDFDVEPPKPQFRVKGELRGLEGSNEKATLFLNGADPIDCGNGPFEFATLLPSGASFAVTIKSPLDYECEGARRSEDPASSRTTEGVIDRSDRNDLVINCKAAETRLTDLRVDEGPLVPSFDANEPPINGYEVGPLKIPLPISSSPPTVHITARISRSSAKLTIAGKEAKSGEPVAIDLKAGNNPIDVVVTAVNGTSATRVINIKGEVNDFLVDTPSYKRSTFMQIAQTFGIQSALAKNTLVVGAPDESLVAQNGGVVFVYTHDDLPAGSMMKPTWKAPPTILRLATSANNDLFGETLTLSADGETIVVGAPGDSINTGAVYIYERAASNGGAWTQVQRLRASNAREDAAFGGSLAISGNTLVVGSPYESSRSAGINGNETNTLMPGAGAVYVFIRNPATRMWSQQAYVKASNPQPSGSFGMSVAIHGDTLAVGMTYDASNATGINGNQADRSAMNAGAVYIFDRVTNGTTWSQKAYVKASNARAMSNFGISLALTSKTLAVGSDAESSNARGINGNQSDTSAQASGAAYTFVRDAAAPSGWKQDAYIKSTNTSADAAFARTLDLTELPDNTDLLAIGSPCEKSAATGINGNEMDTSLICSGAAYVFTRKSGASWDKKAYVKTHPPNGELLDFGSFVRLSGSTLLIGTDIKPGVWIF